VESTRPSLFLLPMIVFARMRQVATSEQWLYGKNAEPAGSLIKVND
jgi:hypothetical protein